MNKHTQLTTLLETTPETLAHTQFNALKAHTISRLQEAIDCIEQEDFVRLYRMLGYSPSGDGYGCDDYYIYMGLLDKPDHTHAYRNIFEILDKLINLKNHFDVEKHTPTKGMVVYDTFDRCVRKIYSCDNYMVYMVELNTAERCDPKQYKDCTVSVLIHDFNNRCIVLKD